MGVVFERECSGSSGVAVEKLVVQAGFGCASGAVCVCSRPSCRA